MRGPILTLLLLCAPASGATVDGDVRPVGVDVRLMVPKHLDHAESWQSVTRHVLGMFEAMLGRIRDDEVYRLLEAESHRQILLFNRRERDNAVPPDVNSLDQLRAAFGAKYKAPFRNARFAFGLKYPSSVRAVLLDEGTIPSVIFEKHSPLHHLLDWDVMAGAAEIMRANTRGQYLFELSYLTRAQRILAQLRAADEADVCALLAETAGD